MGDSFKSTVKPDKNSKIWPCKVCEKTPNEGDELWMQNLGDDANKKWITSPHEECFKKLQENPELGKEKKQFNKFSSSKFPVTDVIKILELSFACYNAFEKKYKIEGEKIPFETKLQGVESFFKSITGGFKP